MLSIGGITQGHFLWKMSWFSVFDNLIKKPFAVGHSLLAFGSSFLAFPFLAFENARQLMVYGSSPEQNGWVAAGPPKGHAWGEVC
ncbi:MAG TPA: hypothetical protein VFK06_23950 [Candidatus Angelobacter sp.]|nr:hypothetical protein [Candidatus Angelobacter sp.]